MNFGDNYNPFLVLCVLKPVQIQAHIIYKCSYIDSQLMTHMVTKGTLYVL